MKENEGGFTLLEILVALVVFGLLMAGLSQTMRFGLTAWTSEARGTADSEDKVAVDGAIRRLIEQAVPGGFVGRADTVGFTSVLPEGAKLTDRLADIVLLVDAGGRLVLRWTPHPAGVPLGPPPAPHEELLLDGVEAIQLGYLVPQPNGPAIWVTRWKGDDLPLLVRLGITFVHVTSWPDLVAAPVARGSDTEG